MASKKPRIPKTRRAKRAAPAVTEKTLGESIIEQMQSVNGHLSVIVEALQERNRMLSVVTSGDTKPTLMSVAAAAFDPAREIEIPPQQTNVAVAPTGKKRGRKSNAEKAALAAAAAAQTSIPAEKQAFVPAAAEFPKQCPCGVREDVPKHLHAKGCPVHFPAEPVPAHRETTSEPTPAPTIDDVRATAISFVGKHGKEKLASMLTKYGADKLSSVPTEKLGALLADLQAAG